MGLIRNLLEDMREAQKAREEMDDDKTTDKYLRSLRRQKRTQGEFLEKIRLKKEIHDFEKERTRNTVIGKMVDDDDVLIKKVIVKKKIQKKKMQILKAKKFRIPKKSPPMGFLSKGNI